MKSFFSASRRAAGFTLIELLIVMALMGVLMGIGMPNLFNFIHRQKILGITQQTAMVFRLARLESIKTANNAVVKLDTAAATVTGYMDLNQNLAQDANEPALWRLDLPKGITVPVTPAALVFRSDGSVAAPGSFGFLNNKGDQLRARILDVASGRVLIEKLQGSTWKVQGDGGQSWTWN